MTFHEISKRYQIPVEILREYQCLKSEGSSLYDEQDITHLSMLVTLHSIGFQPEEAVAYMRLVLDGEETRLQRLQILTQKREETLKEIHKKETQLDQLDYLRFQINP